jgi:hypothetical protein
MGKKRRDTAICWTGEEVRKPGRYVPSAFYGLAYRGDKIACPTRTLN